MNSRTLICTVAGLIAVILLVAFTPRLTYLPQGMVLPAQKTRPAISPDEVTIYNQTPSVNFTRLGHISVEQAYETLNHNTKVLLVEKVKTLAAKVGANGVIVTLLMPTQQLHKMIVFRGAAIYIPSAATRSKQ